MKTLTRLIIVIFTTLIYVTPVQADSLALRFLGTGEIITLNAALQIAGVNLHQDTNLEWPEISNLEMNVLGCWAVPMVDPASEIPLGTGIDCLIPDPTPDSQGEGVSLQALSLFVFDSGTIVTFGLTSVRPFRDGGIGDAGGTVSHITGSIPNNKDGVVGGTGAFAGKVGAARVSGAVFLGDFPGLITFDCLWIVSVEDLLPPGLAKLKAEASLPPGQVKQDR